MELLTFPFMQRALLAALLTGLMAPAIGTYIVQRRLALLGDGLKLNDNPKHLVYAMKATGRSEALNNSSASTVTWIPFQTLTSAPV